ncbi:reverse transcriptase domain-containing protein, partial [Tanacetum coccineum]
MDDEPIWAADHVVALTPGSAINIPETANEFSIKGNHLTLVKGNQFYGRTKIDPHKHIHEFLGICDMFKYRDTEYEFVRLMMFPLSLTGEAKTWLDELNEGTIETWDELRTSFISRFFPLSSFRLTPRRNPSFLSTRKRISNRRLVSYEGNAQKLSWSQSVQRQHYQNLLSWSKQNNLRSSKCRSCSFQYPVGIAENMLFEVGKFTFPADFVILEIEEDSKVPLILGRPFLHTANAVIQVKHKQLNLGVGTERMIFNIDSAMKHSCSNDDTCFSIDVIDEILEEYFDALLNEGSKILHSIKGTLLEEEIFVEFDEFMAMITDENSDSESDTEDPPFKKITINTDYKIK